MSLRQLHQHMHRTGAIEKIEGQRMLSLDELAEMSNKAIYRFLKKERHKGLNYPSYDSVITYKNSVKQTPDNNV